MLFIENKSSIILDGMSIKLIGCHLVRVKKCILNAVINYILDSTILDHPCGADLRQTK